MFCEDLGYNDIVVRGLEQLTILNFIDEFLWNWSIRDVDKVTVGKLINLLKDEDLNRMDVVEIFKGWVQEDLYFRLLIRVIDIFRYIKG